MSKMSKNRKEVIAKIDLNKSYSLNEASSLVKDLSKVKFDESIDLAVRLGVDPKQANQMVRGVASLPHGTGKDLKVLALVTADKEDEAKNAGADFVGLDEYIEKYHPTTSYGRALPFNKSEIGSVLLNEYVNDKIGINEYFKHL